MPKYDPDVLQEYADDLYAKADWITFKFGAAGAILGPVLVMPVIFYENLGEEARLGFAVAFVIGAVIGALFGRRKAFQYRLQAQTVLCQMNTRTQKG